MKVRSRSLIVHFRKNRGLNENHDKRANALTAGLGFARPVGRPQSGVGSAGREGSRGK